MKDTFIERLDEQSCTVAVIGLGYVGLPLVLEFDRAGLPTIGLDVDPGKVNRLAEGDSYIRHIDAAGVHRAFVDPGRGRVTADMSLVREAHAILICVPTPLTAHHEPDLSYVEATADAIAPHLQKGQLVVLESTTYPGTTEEVVVPMLELGSGLVAGQDFMVAYSPEREDPSNASYSTAKIPKVVGGIDAGSLAAASAMYEKIICETVSVSSCRTAEATKLMENIFRSVNIALVNELKLIFTEMDIDVWEVIRAASTKPFGFMPFYPGPGLGGHCIPIDPFYLTWKAREYGVGTEFIELAGKVNTSMPEYVVHRTMLALNHLGKPLKGARVLLVGLAYKGNVDDDRESPTYRLWEELDAHGAAVSYYDPYIRQVGAKREYPHLEGTASCSWEEALGGSYDVAIVSTAHADVDHDALVGAVPLLVDTRGVCADAPNVVRA